jgi:hypothetical protein
MKNSSGIIGIPNRDLPACRAVPQPSVLRRDELYKRGRRLLYFVQPKCTLSCSQCLPLPSVSLSISAGHILISHNFNPLNAELNAICHFIALLGAHPLLHVSRIRVNIHINTIVPSTHISSRWCLRFRLNLCMPISYVMRATFSAHPVLVQPTVCLEPLAIG